MTIDAAIERLTIMERRRENRGYHSETLAIKLGIEALKRLKKHREDHIDITYRALPGETKD